MQEVLMSSSERKAYVIQFDSAQYRAIERVAEARGVHLSVIVREGIEAVTGVPSSIGKAGRPKQEQRNDS
jgi:hypothetical protein